MASLSDLKVKGEKYDFMDTQLRDSNFLDNENNKRRTLELYLRNCDIDDSELEGFDEATITRLNLSGTKVTKIPQFDYSLLMPLYLHNLDYFDSTSLLDEGLLKRPLSIYARNTYMDLSVFKEFEKVSSLIMAHEDYTVEDLKKLTGVAINQLHFSLGDYTGFGDYIKSGDHSPNDIFVYDLDVTDDFLADLKGLKDEDKSFNFLKLINPTF